MLLQQRQRCEACFGAVVEQQQFMLAAAERSVEGWQIPDAKRDERQARQRLDEHQHATPTGTTSPKPMVRNTTPEK